MDLMVGSQYYWNISWIAYYCDISNFHINRGDKIMKRLCPDCGATFEWIKEWNTDFTKER